MQIQIDAKDFRKLQSALAELQGLTLGLSTLATEESTRSSIIGRVNRIEEWTAELISSVVEIPELDTNLKTLEA